MASADKLLKKMRESPQNVRFGELAKVCAQFFGDPTQNGTSHKVYKMPWAGDPRVNIQEGKNGKAKDYQVKQVLQAIDKLQTLKKEAASVAQDEQVESRKDSKGGKKP